MSKRLVRDPRRAVIAGVASGFGLYLDVDPVLVRLALVLLVFANGLGFLLYIAGWLLMPKANASDVAFSTVDAMSSRAAVTGAAVGAAVGNAAEAGVDVLRDAGSRLATEVRSVASGVRASAPASESVQAAVGGLLILVGGFLLADNLGWLEWPWWASFEKLWPLVLVALGVGLVVKSRRPDAVHG